MTGSTGSAPREAFAFSNMRFNIMTKNNLAVLWLIFTLFILSERHASAQEWQSYQVTHFAPPGQVRECSSVADSFGNIHHYFKCDALGGVLVTPLFYMRTDFYGNILTDTVRLDAFAGNSANPFHPTALTDGTHNWCLFTDYDPVRHYQCLFMTERNSDGSEVFPPTVIDYPFEHIFAAGEGMSAVYRPQDQTIHLLRVSVYFRLTTMGDTLIWAHPINGMTPLGAYFPSWVINPADGLPWASMSTADGLGGGAFLVTRFNEDTSQVTHYPLPGSTFGAGPDNYSFGMDASGHADFRGGMDTARFCYLRLDSTFQNIVDYRRLNEIEVAHAALKTDSAGNCLIVWFPDDGVYFAYRRADGIWTHPPTAIDHSRYANFFTIIRMDSTALAFTAECAPRFQDFEQLYLYTYGLPPDTTHDAVPEPCHSNPIVSISAYPNPFTSSLRLELPGGEARAVILYNVLGREVWRQTVPAGMRTLSIDDPVLRELPSGTYYLSLEGSAGSGNARPRGIQIVHTK
jgi:hypothetical protein